jgi:dihydroorotate dehydrogenase
MYAIIRRLFFMLDAEKAHYLAMNILAFFCKIPGIKQIIIALYKAPENAVDAFGLNFKNSIGLGAGFDKNAAYLNALECLGFGHVEIGTVTPLAQEGNPKPRLFRLPKNKALINRMGFNNLGLEAVISNLKNYSGNLIIGGNIGKNKNTPNEDAYKDYSICFNALHPFVHYFTVNVSSPNTPGLRQLQSKESLQKIFNELQKINNTKDQQKPILLKIAPDLNIDDVNDIVDLANNNLFDGLVVSNTTVDRSALSYTQTEIEEIGAGGLSGVPVFLKSTELLKYISSKVSIPIIASGGIFTKDDANEKIKNGAQLIQVWTGFIYQGPSIVKQILS